MIHDVVWNAKTLADRELEALPVGTRLVVRSWGAPGWWVVSEREESEPWCAVFLEVARFRTQVAAIEWSRN
jgi:hypothetical protein